MTSLTHDETLNQRRRARRRLPSRGVRPGPARFELAVTACFVVSMVVAVYTGGPSDLMRALVISIPYLLLGLLVVRRELFAVIPSPLLLSLFMGDSGSNDMHVGDRQVVFWLSSALLFIPMLLVGVSIRRTLDS